MYQPLADKIRPKTLDDVVGQRHLLGENGLLRRVIESGSIPNLIFYGPSGVGKTTVASIIAQQTDRKLYHLNATTAGIADIKAIIDELDTFLAPNGARVYLDEILPGDERLLRIEAIANPYALPPEEAFIKAETLWELYAALDKLEPREQTYVLYRSGFADDVEHTLPGAAIHIHLSENRTKLLEDRSLDTLRSEMP